MNAFALISLSVSVCCSILAIFILKFARNRTQKFWGFFNIAVALWSAGLFEAGISSTQTGAIISWKLAYTVGSFVPIFFYHFTYSFCELNKGKVIRLVYGIGIALIPLVYYQGFITSTIKLFDSIHYHKATFFYSVYIGYVCFVALLAFYELYKFNRISTGIKKNQAMYLFWSFLLGWSGGVTTFAPPYNIPIYPVWHISICFYTIFMTYAIFKYRLIDIEIVITRTGIFLAVYSMVLGIPFALAFGWREQLQRLIGEMWWLAPLISSTVLATIGPSIYLFIQKKAEDQLLQEQRRYQAALRRASLGMGRVKDLNRLLKLTVNIVTRTVGIEHCEVYLTHRLTERYILKASQGWALPDKRVSFIPVDAPLVLYLKRHREPLVYDEVKQRGQDFQDKVLEEIAKIMEELDAALLLPSFIEEDLIAVIVLGKKKSGKLYSQDDLVVFAILANQSALAIENAQFYEEMKKTHDQLMKAEKMATIGTMADGLSHQINNRLHAMGFIAGDALDTIKLQPRESLPMEARKVYEEMETSLMKIQDNVKRGGEIVEGLLKYSRKADEGFSTIELGKLLDAALEMAQFKIKLNQIDIARNFNGAIAKIHGNFTQLQEVFFNMIDNSYDAMMQRKEEMKEHGYRGRLEISTQEDGKNLEIFLKDNGMGVQAKDFKRLFTPFFTTKLSSKKGTGLGLYVIRKIIEENHGGKVEFTSEYQKGSQIRLMLPIAA